MSHRSIFTLSGIAVAALACTALLSQPASARTYERCDADGDHCVRVKCDRDGDSCWQQSEYSRNNRYGGEGNWVCDNDGDRCHYVYAGRQWNPLHWEHEEEEHHHGDRDDD